MYWHVCSMCMWRDQGIKLGGLRIRSFQTEFVSGCGILVKDDKQASNVSETLSGVANKKIGDIFNTTCRTSYMVQVQFINGVLGI